MSRSENFENGSTIEMQIVRVTGELKIGNDQWQTKGSQNLQGVTRKTTAGGGFWRLGREKGHSSFGVVICENCCSLWKLTKCHVVPGYSFHCPLFQQTLWINATTQQGMYNFVLFFTVIRRCSVQSKIPQKQHQVAEIKTREQYQMRKEEHHRERFSLVDFQLILI